MQIKVIAIGSKMPTWVNQGVHEYIKRLPPDFRVELVEIPAQKRHKNAPIEPLLAKEGEALLAAIPKGYRIIALDRLGKSLSTEQLVDQLAKSQNESTSLALLVGGPEGLSPACLNAAHECWSLSALTLPHPLVRILLAEQFYRAWSILSHHPYHR